MTRLPIAVLFGLGLSSCVAAQPARPDAADGTAVESIETTIVEKAAKGAPDITEELLDAAEAGNAEAQFQLGQAHAERAKESLAEAVQWYRRAAKQGYVTAQGAPEVTQELLAAAEAGNAKAQFELSQVHARRITESLAEAARRFLAAAEKGHVDSQIQLALSYLRGLGVAQNYDDAFVWFRMAAEHGNSRAQYYLGSMYALGQGVDQDYAVAMLWWHKAAEQGHAVAQLSLGLKYWLGHGVPNNRERALYWFRKAAEQRIPIPRWAVEALEQE